MESVSLLVSDSVVEKKTYEPSFELPPKSALSAGELPPVGPIEMSVVTPASRMYTSSTPSVSAGTSDSLVLKKTFEPSCEAPP